MFVHLDVDRMREVQADVFDAQHRNRKKYVPVLFKTFGAEAWLPVLSSFQRKDEVMHLTRQNVSDSQCIAARPSNSYDVAACF